MTNEVSLEAMLNAREQRASVINQLQQDFPHQTIISFKLNIPGPIKNTPDYQWAFRQGMNCLTGIAECYLEEITNLTGPEAYLISNQDAETVKKQMVLIEDEHPLGRLFDLDVVSVNRQDLGLSPRKCLLCDQDAHACSRSRNHTLETVLETINQIITAAYQSE
ncbi:citrate lyase holo-[acyl-carrier protein] synthase [Erysipelothrix tonsillarum]|uniref:citrate lyase holo-[acyl-carrier protein] synthase n=1 Tax=Erysipelothrix tonsillarum TaxID=38402 RepID=UPI00036BDCAA|nr:citrate lyase holo-[acyl-carrier protein] synthase [Erysipelothrix tonsillarum]